MTGENMSLTLDEINKMAVKPIQNAPTWYGCMLAGEAGEFANLTKKFQREIESGNPSLADDLRIAIGKEISDVIVGAIISADKFGINLNEVIPAKIEEFKQKLRDKPRESEDYP